MFAILQRYLRDLLHIGRDLQVVVPQFKLISTLLSKTLHSNLNTFFLINTLVTKIARQGGSIGTAAALRGWNIICTAGEGLHEVASVTFGNLMKIETIAPGLHLPQGCCMHHCIVLIWAWWALRHYQGRLPTHFPGQAAATPCNTCYSSLNLETFGSSRLLLGSRVFI